MMYRVCVLSVAVWLGVVAVCHCQVLEKCPPVDHRDANATLIANPYNCSTFYICRQGTPLLFVCPANLHFNDRLKVCDHQRNAGCVQLVTEPTPEVTKVTVTKVEKEFLVVKPNPEVVPPTDEAPAAVSPDAPSDDGLPSKPLGADEHATEPKPEVTKVTETKVQKEVLVVKPNPEDVPLTDEAPAAVSPDAPSEDEHVDPVVGLV